MQGTIKFLPFDKSVRIEFETTADIWMKVYPSMPSATEEAVRLGLLPSYEKLTLDINERMPDTPKLWMCKADVH